MRNAITGALILAACLMAGDKLWSIALAALMILAALAIQNTQKKWRKDHERI